MIIWYGTKETIVDLFQQATGPCLWQVCSPLYVKATITVEMYCESTGFQKGIQIVLLSNGNVEVYCAQQFLGSHCLYFIDKTMLLIIIKLFKFLWLWHNS